MTTSLTPAEPLDLLALLLRPYSNQKLFVIVHFAGKLDQHRLQRATSLLVATHPVVNRLIVRTRSTPGWCVVASKWPCIRIHDCTCGGAPHAADKWPSQETFDDSAMSLNLFCGRVTDSLVFCIDHSVTDAAGAKEAIYRIAANYTQMGRGEVPAGKNTNPQERRLSALAKQISKLRRIQALYQFRMPTGKWSLTRPANDDSTISRYVVRHSNTQFVSNLKDKLATFRATVNDALVASLFAAQTIVCPAASDRRLPVQYTINMRRFLPAVRVAPLANLSGSAHVWLERRRDSNFETILTAANKALIDAKRSLPGLGNALLSESLLRTSYPLAEKLMRHVIRQTFATGKANPILSNFGVLDDEKLRFSDTEISHAYMAGPSLTPPNFMMVASAFMGRITISTGLIGAEKGETPVADMPDLMLETLAQLREKS